MHYLSPCREGLALLRDALVAVRVEKVQWVLRRMGSIVLEVY